VYQWQKNRYCETFYFPTSIWEINELNLIREHCYGGDDGDVVGSVLSHKKSYKRALTMLGEFRE
jgi:hypothetical protein